MRVTKTPLPSIRRYALREPRRSCSALTEAVKATSLDGVLVDTLSSALIHQLAAQELANRVCDLADMGFERKMASVVKMNLRVGIIAGERFGTGGQEEWVGVAPHPEQWRGPPAGGPFKISGRPPRFSAY